MEKNSNDEFGLKTCVNDLQKLYRTDLIFTLFDNEKKIELLGQNDLSQVEMHLKNQLIMQYILIIILLRIVSYIIKIIITKKKYILLSNLKI